MQYDVGVWGHTSQHIQWGGSDDVPIPSLEAASFIGRWYSAWSSSSVTSDSSRSWGRGSEQLWVSCTAHQRWRVVAFFAATRDRLRPLTEFPLTFRAFLLRFSFKAPSGAGIETGCSKSIRSSVGITVGSAMPRSFSPWHCYSFDLNARALKKTPKLVDGERDLSIGPPRGFLQACRRL